MYSGKVGVHFFARTFRRLEQSSTVKHFFLGKLSGHMARITSAASASSIASIDAMGAGSTYLAAIPNSFCSVRDSAKPRQSCSKNFPCCFIRLSSSSIENIRNGIQGGTGHRGYRIVVREVS